MNIQKYIKKLSVSLTIAVMAMMPFIAVQAATTTNNAKPKPFANTVNNLRNTAANGGYSTKNVTEDTFARFLGEIVQTILSFVGVIFALLIIYAGIQWMTAGGDSGSVEKAKSILKNSVIGLIIVLLAMGITEFIAQLFERAI